MRVYKFRWIEKSYTHIVLITAINSIKAWEQFEEKYMETIERGAEFDFVYVETLPTDFERAV